MVMVSRRLQVRLRAVAIDGRASHLFARLSESSVQKLIADAIETSNALDPFGNGWSLGSCLAAGDPINFLPLKIVFGDDSAAFTSFNGGIIESEGMLKDLHTMLWPLMKQLCLVTTAECTMLINTLLPSY